MADKDITQIKVGGFAVSIVGIKDLMEEMAGTHGDKSGDEVSSFMLDRLGQGNYIPGSAREDYAKAFVREFRKFMGQPFTEEPPRGIDVKILGSGCNQCRDLTRTTMDILTEINLAAGVEHVTDIREIARYGLMGFPALLINGKVVAVGKVPPRERIKEWLIQAARSMR